MTCPTCQAENAAAARTCFACGAPLESALADLARGALFASRYEILAPLGRGGMGMVYKARDRELGETVAIKVLRPDLARQSEEVESRFRSEIRLARKVRHRNVCSVYGDGEDRGLLYICMELVEGEDLARAARVAGGLPWAEAWDVALQVADGLRAIHEAGVIHRDLKTANVMRDGQGVVRVMDFGLAKLHAPGAGGITVSGGLMGTPEYMSPEHVRGEEVDFRSDLYSFGVVLHELFTGALPFRGETPLATALKQVEQPPDLSDERLPPALVPVLRRALDKDPDRRYPTAEEMSRALIEAQAASASVRPPGAASRAAPAPAETRTAPPALRTRASAAAASVAAALLAVAASGAYLVQAGRTARSPVPPAPVSPVPTAAPALASPPTSAPRVARPQPSPPPGASGSPSPLAIEPAGIPGEARVYPEDEVDVPPTRLSGIGAPYPEWGPELAPGERVSITASFIVTESGDVTDIRVESGGGELEAVLVQLSRWKYAPGTKDGRPVKVRLRLKHTFVGG